MRSLVVVIDSVGEDKRMMEFDRSPIRIGRGVDNDLRLQLGFVSDRHAQVDFDEASATYVDLGSTNGTFVAGNRLEAHVPIAIEGTLSVELGSIRLEFRPEPARAAPPAASASGRPGRGEAGRAARGNDEFPVITPPDEPPARGEPGPRPRAGVIGEKRGGSGFSTGLPTIFPVDAEEPPATVQRRSSEPPTAPRPPAQPSADRPVRFNDLPVVPLPLPARGRPPAPRDEEPPAAPARPAPRPGPSEESGDVAALRRLGTTFCEELIRLRKAYEVLGREMGIRTFTQSERSRLHEIRDAAEMLRYLTQAATDRQKELQALFADMGTHHLAMLGALVEGARATLARVDPENFRSGRKSLLGRSQNRWEEFAEHFRAFLDDEHAVQATMFGPEFAEAYAAAKGR